MVRVNEGGDQRADADIVSRQFFLAWSMLDASFGPLGFRLELNAEVLLIKG